MILAHRLASGPDPFNQNLTQSARTAGFVQNDEWTNEWMNDNLYIAHIKKLPHKTLRVHSARYTQCMHTCKLSQAKTTKGHSYQKVQTGPSVEERYRVWKWELIAGRLSSERTGLAFGPTPSGQNLTRPSRSDLDRFCTVLSGHSLYNPARFWLHTGRNENASESDPACLLACLLAVSAVMWIPILPKWSMILI